MRYCENSQYTKLRNKTWVRTGNIWPVIHPCIFTMFAEIAMRKFPLYKQCSPIYQSHNGQIVLKKDVLVAEAAVHA